MDSLRLGLRVVRGPDWEWGELDGGEGHVGTVVVVEESMDGGQPVIVQWDSGSRCRCRCGVEGKFDLRVLDSAPTGLQHPHVDCTWCGERSIRGMLWKCAQCCDYTLCTPCYNAGKHSVDHKFNRYDTADLNKRVRLPPRYNLRRIIPRGIFVGSEVVRGHDWQWDDQDGGIGVIGKVFGIEGWEGESGRSVAEVKWRGSRFKNVYRMSHKGKVDLKYTTSATGGFYYPSHLPVLGAPVYVDEQLSAGDSAQVQLDPDLFKIAQQDHGGWDDAMAEFIGRVCLIHAIHGDGNAVVRYSNNRVFLLNLDTLTKVDTQLFRYGQTVRVINDMVKVHRLQKGRAGWNDDMALSLGQLGQVVHIKPNSDVKVVVKGRRWILDPGTLLSAPGESPSEYTAEQICVDVSLRIELLSLMEAKCPDIVTTAVAAGDVGTITNYLRKYPTEINTKADGKGLLHIAIIEGFKPIVEVLLKYKPNVELEDENGEMPLHVCAYCNNYAAAKLLIDAGANVNAVNARGVSPITLAATQGHHEVLEVLLQSPYANVNFPDVEGRTPLHRAVFSHHSGTLRMLLENKADPTLLNFNLFSVAHEAALLGFLSGMEELLRFHPELIGLKKDNGSTPLHVAAANNNYDIVSLLACHPSCIVSGQNNGRLTPLHIAVFEGHVQSVERLVGFGADVNAIAGDGSTPLHLAFGKKNMKTPNKDTPFILKVQEEIEQVHGRGVLSPNMIVGIFLVMQGADLHPKNQLGVSPLKILPVDVATLVSTYKGRSNSFCGGLKELVRPFHNEIPKPIKSRPKIHSAPVASTSLLHNGASNVQAVNRTQAHQPSVSQSLDAPTVADVRRTAIKPHNETPLNDDSKSEKLQLNNVNNISQMTAVKPVATEKDILTCCLCEIGADIKLLPCGHVALCHNCVVSGQGARKCPQIDCRKPLEDRVPVCVFCKKDSNLQFYSICKHTVCNDCKSHHEHCLACQLLADKDDF